jgi:hypothetical protein
VLLDGYIWRLPLATQGGTHDRGLDGFGFGRFGNEMKVGDCGYLG